MKYYEIKNKHEEHDILDGVNLVPLGFKGLEITEEYIRCLLKVFKNKKELCNVKYKF